MKLKLGREFAVSAFFLRPRTRLFWDCRFFFSFRQFRTEQKDKLTGFTQQINCFKIMFKNNSNVNFCDACFTGVVLCRILTKALSRIQPVCASSTSSNCNSRSLRRILIIPVNVHNVQSDHMITQYPCSRKLDTVKYYIRATDRISRPLDQTNQYRMISVILLFGRVRLRKLTWNRHLYEDLGCGEQRRVVIFFKEATRISHGEFPSGTTVVRKIQKRMYGL